MILHLSHEQKHHPYINATMAWKSTSSDVIAIVTKLFCAKFMTIAFMIMRASFLEIVLVGHARPIGAQFHM